MPRQPSQLVIFGGHPGAGSAARELAAEVLRRFGRVRLKVLGTSMLPAICPHDTIDIRNCRRDEVRAGDVVVFARWGRLFAHRVVELGVDGTLLTQGDSHEEPDPRVSGHELLGKVESVTRRSRPMGSPCTWRPTTRIAAGVFRRFSLARWLFCRWHAHRRGARL